MSDFRILEGDVIQRLRELPSNSFQGALCDPPYGLSFMGKQWDHGVPGPLVWAELRRVLVPGSYLLAFGGSRTHHRLACAIEDAGFELCDCMMWLYGQGFPKSLNIQKAMDKEDGVEGEIVASREEHNICRPQGGGHERLMTSAGSREARTIVQRVPGSPESERWQGYGTALKPAWEPVLIAMKPVAESFVDNARRWGVAGLNIEGNLVGGEAVRGGGGFRGSRADGWTRPGQAEAHPTSAHVGRWPANLVVDEDAADMLDQQSGILTSGNNPARRSADKHRRVYAGWRGAQRLVRRGTDSGGASRFFYCAKASQRERRAGTKGNQHPTVKPLRLTEHLARLILPPPGILRSILTPYCGSGSELVGALLAGWDAGIGIDSDPAWCEVARQRIAHYGQTPDTNVLSPEVRATAEDCSNPKLGEVSV